MFKNKFSWSFTAVDQYEKCPYQYYRNRVKKDVLFTESKALKRGNDVHAYLEFGVKSGMLREVLPDYKDKEKLDTWLTLVRKLKNNGCKIGAETEMALDKGLKPISWYSKEAWQRTKIDLWIYHEDKKRLDVYDYKTGKPRVTDQLQLTAGIAAYFFADQMKFDTIRCTFLYLDHPPSDGKGLFESHREEFDTKQRATIIKSWLPALQSIDDDMSAGEWEKKKSWACGWCNVTDCPNNKG